MVASTLQKLYGYLKGYETCCYTGSSKSEVASSIFELLEDELKISFPEITASELDNFKNEIAKYTDLYLSKFYERMRKVKTSIIVKEVADKAKEDSNQLSELVSIIMQGSKQPLLCLGVSPLTTKGEVYSPMDICDGCPWYLNQKFCLLWQTQDGDLASDLLGQAFEFKLPESKYLALGMLKMTNYLITHLEVDLNRLSAYYMLFNHMLVCSKAFELMNPSGEAREDQIVKTVELLTSPPLDRNSEKYQNYLNVLESVFLDIKEGKKKYIQDIKHALERNLDFINSQYDEVEDSYYSLKGTGQSKYTGCHESIISSANEVDWYKDQFAEFDKYTGYISRYKDKDNLDLTQDKVYCIRTILINNPGKFKGRIIHIFDNPIQDRCNYIQRRTSRILESMQCDCMKDQDKGRQFLATKTLEWFTEENPANRIGIYTFDFSNATDTLDQYFQFKILEFIFGPEVANFWDTVSRLPKYIQHVDGTYTRYDQQCGQPQGGLSSFNDFSLAHHFIFLMDMKILGFEDKFASEFYRVLGDDSTCNSMEPEIDYYDPVNPNRDEEGIPRSDIEVLHLDICKHFAGFSINYSKSESTHYDSLEAKLDFAKVTYRNGAFFSPVPFRLAMNYSKSNSAKLAVAIWRGARKEAQCVAFMDNILRRINNTTVSAIVKSGVLEFLDPFWDQRIEFNSSWLARLRYCSAISHMKMMLSLMELKDKDRDWATSDSYDEAFMKLLTKRQITAINDVDPNHKIFKVIERNEYLVNLTKEVFLMEDQDDKVLALLMSPLVADKISNQGLVDQLIDINDTRKKLILASKSENVDISTIFPDFDVKFTKKMSSFSNVFMTRGIAKRPREEAVLFDYILEGMHQIDDVLGYLYPTGPTAEITIDQQLRLSTSMKQEC